ncbi:CRP/FNR family transcriptional regulator, anaerobic regulatory protein/CRP/FNR family transcriptional regulator, nitrogen fixation regulation protein [Jannaschia faecimaris]|uniref:CRP/FNR family transcriptional regulator, anaerobic regulatory protein/CRP/FNR family transcriptional regulator, nitrogen fixation regulation protein n=1 Tax=Jannaschia faecimaris TaxID=1244108 RepID=A0A1H3SQD9_9RHOB|nr:helix-turn-helix domain-containing protein [Jannaschia faecimaris]SDZ40283.1 CRP/FNR family transcriptional regulator, anaerobic regulatory protein/CRP/FNR family transcriptional regulator, nitrogen fixation regulation protein [Jannaschia faecimaris]
MLALNPSERRVHVAPRRIQLHPVRTLREGESLFRETDPASYLFEVVSGVLRLTRLLETGRRHVIGFAHAGDIVGFSADGRHSADCEALSPAALLAHPRGVLEGSEDDGDTHQQVQLAALRQIETLQDHLLLMARPGACGKLASFILALANRHGSDVEGRLVVELEMPRADIADYLCMTVETVSRSLTKMRTRNLIRLETSQRIIILDRTGLEELAMAE